MPDETPPVRSRTTTWEDPRPAAKAAMGLAGIDYMRAIMAGEVPPPPIAVTLDFTLAEVEEGRAVFACEPGEHHYNPIGVVHGGLVSTLIDSTTGCAVHTTLPKGMAYTTVNLSVDMLRPVTSTTGTIRAVGTVVHRGSRIAIATGEVIADKDGKVYARGQSTCLIFPVDAAAAAKA
jgi:uncharacterized protein (TIGR00369 family)